MDISTRCRRALQLIYYELLAYQCWVGRVADGSHEYDSAGCQADTSVLRAALAHHLRSLLLINLALKLEQRFLT